MKFYKKIKKDSDLVKCLACRHYCTIPSNSFGLCGARKNINGELILLTHSRPCSVNLDPIEKKPLYHFLPNSKTLSIGFFGCNFKCSFCQNNDISTTKGTALEQNVNYLNKVTPKDFVHSAVESKAESITFTYNEPSINVEYNLEAIKEAKKIKGKNELKTIYVSNGYLSTEQIKELTKKPTKLDAINIDLKSFDEKFYRNICGGGLEGVLNCIKEMHKKGIWIELTTLIIADKNNSIDELNQIADWIYDLDKNIPWHVSAFFPMHKMQNERATSEKEVLDAVKIGKQKGLNFVYGGNLTKPNKDSNTYCPKCHSLLIERIGFSAKIVGLTKGKCITCKRKLEGTFK